MASHWSWKSAPKPTNTLPDQKKHPNSGPECTPTGHSMRFDIYGGMLRRSENWLVKLSSPQPPTPVSKSFFPSASKVLFFSPLRGNTVPDRLKKLEFGPKMHPHRAQYEI